jgi:fatty acid desaturase
MKRSSQFKVLWTVWMSVGGVAIAAIVYAITKSLGWAAVGLVVSGTVLNMIGHAISRPLRAILGSRHRHL